MTKEEENQEKKFYRVADLSVQAGEDEFDRVTKSRYESAQTLHEWVGV